MIPTAVQSALSNPTALDHMIADLRAAMAIATDRRDYVLADRIGRQLSARLRAALAIADGDLSLWIALESKGGEQ